jgi:hypothetical protein
VSLEVGHFASDYEILGVLGKGGMGRVYRVRHLISNRIEAMKVLLADVAAEAELSERFMGEIRTLARLDHPNIAKFHTAFQLENQLVMIMEFVEGVSLAERSKQGLIPLDEVLSYITQILTALAYAHHNGVIHRDIKPLNIMVTPNGIVKLMDFGIAKSAADPLRTRPGTTMGSVFYISPEQVRGTTVDARSDLYSVGVLLYELTAGRRPFEAEDTFAILQAQLNTPPQPPRELNLALPKALNDIILTAMEKDPLRRFQSADAFRNALESVRIRPGAESQLAQAQAAAQPAHKGTRGRWMALGAFACVCVLVAAAVILPHFWKSSASSKLQSAAHQTGPSPPPPVPANTPSTSPVPKVGTTFARAVIPAPPVSPVPGAVPRPAPSPVYDTSPAVRKPASRVLSGQSPVADGVPQTLPPSPQQTQTVGPPPEPFDGQMESASEDLMKLRSRADAVRGSLNHLRGEQGMSGLSINPDIASSASRMDSYLQAAARTLQSNNLDLTRKNMDRAEREINRLEAFFGR